MVTNSTRSSHGCRVVVGAEAVAALRHDAPDVPIVALVDASSPLDAVLVQAAGADIVLPTTMLDGQPMVNPPGLEAARRAANSVALRRTERERSARRAGHDLAGALHVIGLAAEVGTSGAIDPIEALRHIAEQAKEAGVLAERAVLCSLSAVGTARDELEERVATVDQATAQANILEGVVRHAPLDESLDAIVAAIEHQLADTTCSILLQRSGRTLHHGAGARLPVTYRVAIDGVAVGPGQGSCGTAAFTGRPVVASDVTTDRNWEAFRDVAIAHGLRSCWSTPIVAAEGGEVLGTFAVYRSEVWTPDEAAVRLVERFTHLAAVAIEHARLFGALAESESRFRSAFEGASSGMALVRLDGTLLKVNPALAAMLGPSAYDVSSTNLVDLIDAFHRRTVTAAWQRLVTGVETLPTDRRLVEVPLATNRNGATVWVSLGTSIVTDPVGGRRYFYLEVRDVSADRRHLEEQRARRTAEAANQAKTDFLALVSHELRTPLNAILGFAQVMQMVDLDPAQRADGVDQIVRAGEHLRDLIDELLDLSRIEAGQLSVVITEIEAGALVGEVLDLVRPLAASRHIELVEPTSDDGKFRFHADRRCARQVLINLVGNAVKFTPLGGRVQLDVGSVADGMVRIGVTDSGPGIAPASISELFQPFHRLEREGQAHSQGTGLGLALSARLMDEMQGRIGVESTPGMGSCFWVDFAPAGVASRVSA